MNNGVSINVEQILDLAASIKSSGNEIIDIYNSNCKPAFELSKECIILSGLDFNQFEQQLESIYTKLGESIINCGDFLGNVANNYNDISQVIVNRFNNDIAERIQAILGVSMITGNGISGTMTEDEMRTKMAENSAKWADASPEEKDRLHQENLGYAKELGLEFDEKTGGYNNLGETTP